MSYTEFGPDVPLGTLPGAAKPGVAVDFKPAESRVQQSESGPGEAFYQWLSRILKKCKKADIYAIFFDPVLEEDVPQYRNIIKNPMDFSLVALKIDHKVYQNLGQFADDLYLIAANAMYFNQKETEYHKQALVQREVATTWCDKAYNSITEQERQGYHLGVGCGPIGNLIQDTPTLVCRRISDIVADNDMEDVDLSIYTVDLQELQSRPSQPSSRKSGARGEMKRKSPSPGDAASKKKGKTTTWRRPSKRNAKMGRLAAGATAGGENSSAQDDQFVLESINRLMTGGKVIAEKGMSAALWLGRGSGLFSKDPPIKQIRHEFGAMQKTESPNPLLLLLCAAFYWKCAFPRKRSRSEIPVPSPAAYADSLYKFLFSEKMSATERLKAVSRLPYPFDFFLEGQIEAATSGAPNLWEKK